MGCANSREVIKVKPYCLNNGFNTPDSNNLNYKEDENKMRILNSEIMQVMKGQNPETINNKIQDEQQKISNKSIGAKKHDSSFYFHYSQKDDNQMPLENSQDNEDEDKNSNHLSKEQEQVKNNPSNERVNELLEFNSIHDIQEEKEINTTNCLKNNESYIIHNKIYTKNVRFIDELKSYKITSSTNLFIEFNIMKKIKSYKNKNVYKIYEKINNEYRSYISNKSMPNEGEKEIIKKHILKTHPLINNKIFTSKKLFKNDDIAKLYSFFNQDENTLESNSSEVIQLLDSIENSREINDELRKEKIDFYCKRLSNIIEEKKISDILENNAKDLSKNSFNKIEKIYIRSLRIYIVYNYLEGEDLVSFSKKLQKMNVKRLFVKVIMNDLIKKMIFLIKNNIFHRDIKLDNIIININDNYIEDSDEPLIRLGIIDFESSAIYKENDENKNFIEKSIVSKNSIIGSVPYIAPEVLISQTYSEKSDLWAFGVCMYSLIFREFPFPVKKIEQLIERIKEGSIDDSEKIILVSKIFDVKSNTKLNFRCSQLNKIEADILYSIFQFNPTHRPSFHELSTLKYFNLRK